MKIAESTTHCGIGIVSELIKWEVVWDGQRAEGARRPLSPDALTASLPAKTQTSGPIVPCFCCRGKEWTEETTAVKVERSSLGVEATKVLCPNTWTEGSARSAGPSVSWDQSVLPYWPSSFIKWCIHKALWWLQIHYNAVCFYVLTGKVGRNSSSCPGIMKCINNVCRAAHKRWQRATAEPIRPQQH